MEHLKQNAKFYIGMFVKTVLSGAVFYYVNCANSHIANPNSEKNTIFEIYSRDLVTKLKTMTLNNEKSALISLEQIGMVDLFVYIKKEGYYTRLIKCVNGDSIYFNLKSVNQNKICGVIFNGMPLLIPTKILTVIIEINPYYYIFHKTIKKLLFPRAFFLP